MQHFSDEVFADLVRGTDVPAQTELLSHLATRCGQCTQTFKIWQRLQAIGARENTYCPPADSVRMVKFEFEARRASESELAGKLVFDSLSQPALAGVRSAGTAAARQVVYEAEGIVVDLRFERPGRSKCISLIGQVLDQNAPSVSLGKASVMLWTQKGLVLAETQTNVSGEFHLEFEAQNCLRLSIQASARTLIRIPLANLIAAQENDGVTGSYC
jgi:hypothetical protein